MTLALAPGASAGAPDAGPQYLFGPSDHDSVYVSEAVLPFSVYDLHLSRPCLQASYTSSGQLYGICLAQGMWGDTLT